MVKLCDVLVRHDGLLSIPIQQRRLLNIEGGQVFELLGDGSHLILRYRIQHRESRTCTICNRQNPELAVSEFISICEVCLTRIEQAKKRRAMARDILREI